MMFSRALSLFLLATVIASAVPRLTAQMDPCYCILTATWDVAEDRWEADACAGNCLPVEGRCVDDSEWIEGTLFVWCKCSDTTADPSCNCKGRVRNPNYDPLQAVPLVICTTIRPCSLFGQSCSHYHLLNPPGTAWPICVCQ